MRRKTAALALIIGALAVLFVDRPSAAQQTLVGAGSTWKYSDTGTNLGTAWRTAGYSDAAWASGGAQPGYGDGDEITLVSYGGNTSNRFITTYFRQSFAVTNPSSIAALTMRVLRDDGCVVYLNGTEVWRSNLPSGTISSATLATTAIGGVDESAWHQVAIDPALLITGNNLIAVEVHQQAVTSSDVSFDLELTATTVTPPVSIGVQLLAPADDGVVNATAVTFSANVSAGAGLQSATLQLSSPALTVAFAGAAAIQDAQITAETPTTANGGALSINVDGQTPHAHALMKFPTLIGGGAGQVPSGSIIASATLVLTCTNAGIAMRAYRLTQDWNEDQATWNQPQTGVAWGAPGADGAASNAGVVQTADCTATGLRNVDLTRFVQEWAAGQPNYGMVFTDGGTDGIDFASSESPTSPVLTVVFSLPVAPFQTIGLTGTAATATFSVTLPAGTSFNWNVEVLDSTGLTGRAAADFQLRYSPAAPDAPVVISPADGAVDVDPATSLVAGVGTPGGGSITATASIRKASREEFTIVVMPDTQHYSEAFPAIFTAQTQWIVAQKAARNIVFMTHEGDIVQNAGNVTEWNRANTSLSILDGVLPYGMAPGNHDQPSTLYNQYFPFTRYQGLPWYGGHYQNLNDNNFQLFSGGGIDFIAVHLEFCPPAAAVAWAKSVLDAHPNRIGMMTTHGYLNEAAQRTVHGCSNTQYLWDNLGAITPNLHFMLSGHVHDESRREDTANGHPVFQMLADYQDRASGGEGWLRIMRFVPAEDTVYVHTYSPWLDRYETDANSEFTLNFPMSSPWFSATTTVPSGSAAQFNTTGLEAGTKYEWRVTATNSSGVSRTGPLWTFTTGAGAPLNQPPIAAGESYSVTIGGSLSIAAPGLLANDGDPEGAALSTQLVSGPSNGILSLGANGSFTYTPAAGYSGGDSFSYRVTDGSLSSATVVVNLTVAGIPPGPLFTAAFTSGADGFTYLDNTFRGTNQAAYAEGVRVSTGGFSGGALRVYVGGINSNTINNMSGGWRRTFTLAAPAAISLTFRYRMDQGSDYESDEVSQVLASLNGLLVGGGAGGYIAQVAGNGNGGPSINTGWQLVTIDLGTLAAGTHTLTLGGFNSRKNSTSERTTILIDDVSVVVR